MLDSKSFVRARNSPGGRDKRASLKCHSFPLLFPVALLDQTLCSDDGRASSTIASDDGPVPIGSTTTDTDYQWSLPYREPRQDRSRSHYEKRISELEQKLLEVVASEARKKRSLERKDREIRGLQAQLEEQENQLRDVQDTLNDMQEDAEVLDNELDRERRRRAAGEVRIRELEERARLSNAMSPASSTNSRSTYQSRATSRVGNIFQVSLDNVSLSQTASSAHATQRRAVNPLRLERPHNQHFQMRLLPLSRSSAYGTLVGSDSGNSEVTAVEPTRRSEPILYRGSEILWRGYGVPKSTPVPACTASDGYHHFSGKGTNGYKTRYTCTICHFVCSESRH